LGTDKPVPGLNVNPVPSKINQPVLIDQLPAVRTKAFEPPTIANELTPRATLPAVCVKVAAVNVIGVITPELTILETTVNVPVEFTTIFGISTEAANVATGAVPVNDNPSVVPVEL